MPLRLLALFSVAALAPLPAFAAALDFRSVGEATVLYDSPSTKGKKLWVILRGTPVEAIIGLDQWVKVRDASGAIAWIEKKSLATQRTVIVTSEGAELRQQPDSASAVQFALGREVVLELQETLASGWVKLKYRDGTVGYLRASEVWGE